jgi:hypothetical protein
MTARATHFCLVKRNHSVMQASALVLQCALLKANGLVDLFLTARLS